MEILPCPIGCLHIRSFLSFSTASTQSQYWVLKQRKLQRVGEIPLLRFFSEVFVLFLFSFLEHHLDAFLPLHLFRNFSVFLSCCLHWSRCLCIVKHWGLNHWVQALVVLVLKVPSSITLACLQSVCQNNYL